MSMPPAIEEEDCRLAELPLGENEHQIGASFEMQIGGVWLQGTVCGLPELMEMSEEDPRLVCKWKVLCEDVPVNCQVMDEHGNLLESGWKTHSGTDWRNCKNAGSTSNCCLYDCLTLERMHRGRNFMMSSCIFPSIMDIGNIATSMRPCRHPCFFFATTAP